MADIKTEVRELSVKAVITRADGKIEDLGLVSYQSTNPMKMWVYNIGKRLGLFRR